MVGQRNSWGNVLIRRGAFHLVERICSRVVLGGPELGLNHSQSTMLYAFAVTSGPEREVGFESATPL